MVLYWAFVVCLADTYEVCHVATHLPASQSSVFVDTAGSTFGPSYANDGGHSSTHGVSCSHSQFETHPWWSVDLGVPLTVTGVFFLNRNHAGM